MRFLALVVYLATVTGVAAEKDAKTRGDVEITEIQAASENGVTRFTGTVKVTRTKPIRGLVLKLHFHDSIDKLLTILSDTIEEGTVHRGDEIDFELYADYVPRAVAYRAIVFSGGNMELRTLGSGPYYWDSE